MTFLDSCWFLDCCWEIPVGQAVSAPTSTQPSFNLTESSLRDCLETSAPMQCHRSNTWQLRRPVGRVSLVAPLPPTQPPNLSLDRIRTNTILQPQTVDVESVDFLKTFYCILIYWSRSDLKRLQIPWRRSLSIWGSLGTGYPLGKSHNLNHVASFIFKSSHKIQHPKGRFSCWACSRSTSCQGSPGWGHGTRPGLRSSQHWDRATTFPPTLESFKTCRQHHCQNKTYFCKQNTALVSVVYKIVGLFIPIKHSSNFRKKFPFESILEKKKPSSLIHKELPLQQAKTKHKIFRPGNKKLAIWEKLPFFAVLQKKVFTLLPLHRLEYLCGVLLHHVCVYDGYIPCYIGHGFHI